MDNLMFWSIILGMMLTTLLIVLNLKKFYNYFLEQKNKRIQAIYNGCPIGISVEEKMDDLLYKQERSWERGTKRISREKIDDEFNDIQSDALWILLRHADEDKSLNGEVKSTIKKFVKLKEKKAEFVRNELIE